MAATNGTGDKLHMFVIGKVKKPLCFKKTKFLLCSRRNQHKSWMDGTEFEEWIRELDRKFASKARNVALVIDN